VKVAEKCALAVGAGHTFYLVLGPGTYPINVLDRVKSCPEVCHIFCATANPVQVIRVRAEQGAGILGVVDGSSPLGVEGRADKEARKSMLRRFGYKYC
jgi:adenosine/AMP kinase